MLVHYVGKRGKTVSSGGSAPQDIAYPSGSATLTTHYIEIPTTRVDGSAFTAAYMVIAGGSSSGSRTWQKVYSSPTDGIKTLTSIAAGTYYFDITYYDSNLLTSDSDFEWTATAA